MFDLWGFKKVIHPMRGHSIWIPFGVGLSATRNEFGLSYVDPQNRVRIDFTTVPNVAISANFDAIVNNVLAKRAAINYKLIKNNWYVISATTPDGIDYYLRYHRDGSNVTGFTLSWNNANGNVHGDRIAILMSASLWSSMTGASFIDPPALEPKVVGQPSSVPPPAPAQEAGARPAVPPVSPPTTETRLSTGTGFFVAHDGSFVTSAHVIEDCLLVYVKADDGFILDARIAAKDTANDLALLKLPKAPAKVASLRTSVRLGEGIAAFGFPHSYILSTSGNFTLGNITALSGMANDSRYLQISAPVQSGNSRQPQQSRGEARLTKARYDVGIMLQCGASS